MKERCRALQRRTSLAVSRKFVEEQPQILRLTIPWLKRTPGAPFAQDDSGFVENTPGND
jgi:hypothetical protein